MKVKQEYLFEWEARVRRSVVIEAESEEEAHQKWVDGDFGNTDVDDEDMLDNYVEMNGEAFWNNRFERVHFGHEKE